MREFFATPHNARKLLQVLQAWKGTPYRHCCAVKKRGVDCARFVVSVLAEIGVAHDFDPGYYPGDWDTHDREETREFFLCNFEKYRSKLLQKYSLEQTDSAPKLGDWAVFALSPLGFSNHSGIILRGGLFCHAIQRAGVIVEKLSNYQRPSKIFRLYEVQ